MDTQANDGKRKKVVAETPVDEALKRAAEPVFERHQPVQPTANSGGTQAVGQPVGSAGQALPLDPAAAAHNREATSKALAGLVRLIDGTIDKALHRVAKKVGSPEFADALMAETGITEEELKTSCDLTALIAEEHGWVMRYWKEWTLGGIAVGVLWRKGTAVKDLVTRIKEQKAAIAAQQAPQASN